MTEYKIFTKTGWAGVYFRSGDCDWIFLAEWFGPEAVAQAEEYLKRVKES